MPDAITWRSDWKPSELEPGSWWWLKTRDDRPEPGIAKHELVFLRGEPFAIGDNDDRGFLLGPRIRPEDSAELERLRKKNASLQAAAEALLDVIGQLAGDGEEEEEEEGEEAETDDD